MAPTMQPLLLVVVTAAALIFCLGVSVAAAATPPSTRLPGSCLMAASSLCSSTNTNALRCLRKLAMKQDARVPASCANALLGGAAASQSQAGRTQRMARMLNEGGCNNCAAAGSGLRCNDVLTGCGGCSQSTLTLGFGQNSNVAGPAAVACSSICCEGKGDRPVCCFLHNGRAACAVTSAGQCQ